MCGDYGVFFNASMRVNLFPCLEIIYVFHLHVDIFSRMFLVKVVKKIK